MEQEKIKCAICGKELIPAPARFDGEATFVGYLPHTCTPPNPSSAEQMQEDVKEWVDKEAIAYGQNEWDDSGVTNDTELTFKGMALIQMSAEDYKAGATAAINKLQNKCAEKDKEKEMWVGLFEAANNKLSDSVKDVDMFKNLIRELLRNIERYEPDFSHVIKQWDSYINIENNLL